MIQPGTFIYASTVQRGMVIEVDGGKFDVCHVAEGYDRFTFTSASGYTATVEYGAMVKVLGYFNP